MRPRQSPTPTNPLGDAVAANTSGVTWNVRAVGAHGTPFDGTGIKVAVLDTGIDRGHPAFANSNIIEQDFTGTGNGDRQGHGTHCAGTICGSAINGLRFSIAPKVAALLAGKVLDDRGDGTTEGIAKGIQWAMDQGAHVISMSLGMDFPGFVELLVEQEGLPIPFATCKALEAYRANMDLFGQIAELAETKAQGGFSQPTIIIAAAGNESQHSAGETFILTAAPPASAAGITAVGAVGQSPQGFVVADFSNINVDVCAPGVDIISARRGGGLVSFSGTSMATPCVAGVAALWAQRLLQQTGMLSSTALTAKLIAGGSFAGFAPPINFAAFGTGMVQAPKS